MSRFIPSRLAMAVAAAPFLLSAANASFSQDDDVDAMLEEVVVTASFRASIEKALDASRNEVSVRESIMAEDIGKFPDLNLAESLQRISGVSITREGGEGRQITLRGLSPGFTRTTLNGMEVPASTDGLDSVNGVNTGRGFDFNVFASELFNRIDIQKSARAGVEEGGIAGSVDLYTAKPFDKPGFNAALSGQGAFNIDYDTTDPRVAGLISNTFADETVGVLLSFAHTERTVRQEGFGSVRWSYPEDDGDEWADLSSTVIRGTQFTDAQLNDGTVWFPRLPRTDIFNNDQERTGVTFALQFRPTEEVELGFDYAASKLENNRDSYNLFAQFRSRYETLTPVELTISDSGVATQGVFDGVVTRSESRRDTSETDFDQFVFSGKYDISDSLSLSGMFGVASSEFVRDYFRINLDSPVARFEYDFGGSNDIAALRYGYDISDISLYTPTRPDVRKWEVERDNQTFRLDLTWTGEQSTITGGIIANDRQVDAAFSRSTGGSYNVDASEVTATSIGEALPVSDFGTALGVPGDFPTTWAVIDFNAAEAAFGRGDEALQEGNGNTFDVTEETLGAYLDISNTSELMGLPLHSNFGVRVVETTTTVKGVTSVGPVEIENTYLDVLPSANFAWEVHDDVQLRMAMGRTMTRPGLNSLRVNNSYEEISGRVTGGNPELDPVRSTDVDVAAEWYFAEGSALKLAYFNKQIEGLIVSSTFEDFVDPDIAAAIVSDPNFDPGRDIDPRTDAYEFSAPINSGNSEFSGFELSYQQGFEDILPAPFNNLGVVANYTAVDASTELNGENVEFEGLSDSLYNFTVYYETDKFGVRLSTNYRSDYITDITGSDGNAEHGTSGQTRYDISAVYNLNDNISFTLEGINLTNVEDRLFTTGDGSLDLVREFNATGRQVFLGVRATF